MEVWGNLEIARPWTRPISLYFYHTAVQPLNHRYVVATPLFSEASATIKFMISLEKYPDPSASVLEAGIIAGLVLNAEPM